jgi:hypothetical protein
MNTQNPSNQEMALKKTVTILSLLAMPLFSAQAIACGGGADGKTSQSFPYYSQTKALETFIILSSDTRGSEAQKVSFDVPATGKEAKG